MSLISLSNQSQDNKEQNAPAFSFKNYFKSPIIIPPNSTIKLLSTKITKNGQRLSAKDNKGLMYSRNATGYSTVQMTDRFSGSTVQKEIYAACPILHNLVNGDDGTHVDAGAIATELTDKINATQVMGKLQPSKIDGAMNNSTSPDTTFPTTSKEKPYVDNYGTRGSWFGIEMDETTATPQPKLVALQLPWAGQADPDVATNPLGKGGNLNNKNYRRAGSKSATNVREQQVYSTTDSLTVYPNHEDTNIAGGVAEYVTIEHTCQNALVANSVLSGAAFGNPGTDGSCEWTRQPNTYCWWGLHRQDDNERFPACCMGLMNTTWRKIVGENDNAQIQWALANGSYDGATNTPSLGLRQAYVYDHETMPMLQYAAVFENSAGEDVLQIFQSSKSPHLAYVDLLSGVPDDSWQKLSVEIPLPDFADADQIYIKCQVPGDHTLDNGDGYGFEWSIAGDDKGGTGNTTTDWGATFASDAGDPPLVAINQAADAVRAIVANDYRYLPNMGSINPAILYGPEIGAGASLPQVSTCEMAVYGNGTVGDATTVGHGAMCITNTPMTYGLWNSNEGNSGANYKLWQPEDLYTTWDEIVRYYDPRFMGPVLKTAIEQCEDNITTLNTYSLANNVADNLQIVASRLTLEATSVRDNKYWKDILQIYGADGLPRDSAGKLQTFGKLGLALGMSKKIIFKTNTFSTNTPSFTLEDQFGTFADITNYSAYHLQLTNLPIISYNGTANKRVKDIAVLIAPVYSQPSDALSTIVEYDMPTPIPIRLNNKETLTLDTIDVLITYNNNHPARELVGEIDISLLLE